MPKVSVIIPVYNTEKYLRECLDSVVNQTLKDIEIICINDGSTDNSLAILNEYSAKDNRIKIISQENSGQAVARNNALTLATGEYTMFIDSDDYIKYDTLEILYKRVVDYNLDMLSFGGTNFDNETKENLDNPYYELRYLPENFNTDCFNYKDCTDFIAKMTVSSCLTMYKHSFIKKNEIKFPAHLYFEDNIFFHKALLNAERCGILKEKLYFRRVHPSSTTQNWEKHHLDYIKIVGLLLDYLKSINIDKSIYKNYKKTYSNIVISKYNSFDEKYKKLYYKAVKSFCKKYNPSNIEKIEKPLTVLDYIFSIRNEDTRKVITFFGLKLKIKSKKLEQKEKIKKLNKKVKKLGNQISELKELNKKIDNQSILIQEQAALIEEQESLIKEQNQKIEEQYINLSQQVNQQNKINEQLTAQITENNSAIFDLYLDSLNNEKDNSDTNIQNILEKVTQIPEYLPVDSSHNYLNILLNMEEFSYKRNKFNNDNILISWETARWNNNIDIVYNAIKTNKKLIFIGDSFLRSIDTFANKNAISKYQKGISFGIDDLAYYYDGSRPTRMEYMLNDKTLIISEEQKQRARNCINKITETHLTKYNHQPIYEPKIGRDGVEKILVVDQSYGDMSIAKGLANDDTFAQMLNDAIKENPNADIIVKTHPDTMAGIGGYYKGLEPHDNVYTMTEPINPISLIKYCNKVYVCTTQLGFEALMCGKEVHVYGMPFYAGWGLTHDMQKCERRTNTRSLEEIFYIAYIMYSYYVNPNKKCRCEIEEAMDYLLNLREEYFAKSK